MKTHDLKILSEHFQAIKKREKTFDIRKNDRDFQKGDILILREFKPCERCGGFGRAIFDVPDFDNCCNPPHGIYTGKKLKRKITYISNNHPGLNQFYVVMAIKPV
jgi:hypothetical protein